MGIIFDLSIKLTVNDESIFSSSDSGGP